MKKTLNHIFDDANAGEIENLVKQNAAPEVSADTLASIKSKVYARTNLNKETKSAKSVWVRALAIAACLVLLISAIIVVPMLREDDPGIDTPPDTSTIDDTPGKNRPLYWSDISSFFGSSGSSGNVSNPTEMYEIVFYEITSGVYSDYKHGSIIGEDFVGEKIDTVVIKTGWYQSWNGEERDVYEVNAEVYEIDGIDTTVSVAIKYLQKPHGDSEEYFYVFSNPYGLDADSLSGFFEAYDADKHMSIYTNAHIREYNEGVSTNFAIYNVDKSAVGAINSQILSLTSTKTYSKYTDSDINAIKNITNTCRERLQISVEIKSAGRYGVVYILDNGYICFTGFGDFFALHNIGSDAAQALIDTVKSNSKCINPSVEEETLTMQPD